MSVWGLIATVLLAGAVVADNVAPPASKASPPGVVPGNFPPKPDTPVLKLVPKPPPKQLADLPAEQFPAEPPKPPASNEPPPLSPSGRWLHSMVFIQGRAYVYGGVGSYSSALYNDMWLYNFADREWSELQASYVPPFPVVDKSHPQVNMPQGPTNLYRPDDAPPQPPLKDQPGGGQIVVPAEPPSANPAVKPVFQATPKKPLSVVKYEGPPTQGSKPPGYSLLQEQQREVTDDSQRTNAGGVDHRKSQPMTSRDHYSFLQQTLKSSTSNRVRSLLAHRIRNELRSQDSVHGKHGGKRRQRRQSTAFIRLAERVHARSKASDAPEPARFWKNDALSPTLMSPFIAADLWELDLYTKRWKNVKSKSRDIPAPRWLHTAVTVNGRMVVFGGVSYSDTILGDVWVFDPKDASWVKANPKGDPILPREGHSAVIMKESEMMVFGGISYGQMPFNDLWKYDAARNAWFIVKAKGVAPPPRWMHTAAVHKDKEGKERMYIFGGVTRNFVPLDDLWFFDGTSMSWVHPAAKGYPPFPRMLHTSEVTQDRLMIFAGIANNIPLEDTWVYDMANDRWHEEHPSTAYPFAREGAALIKVTPPTASFEPQKREPWLPPKPIPVSERLSKKALMPLIKDHLSERSLNRFRKEYNYNRFLILFGGAGPKPQ